MPQPWPPIDLEPPDKPPAPEPDIPAPDDPVAYLARHSGRALTVAGSSKDDGAAIVQFDRRDKFNQLWVPVQTN